VLAEAAATFDLPFPLDLELTLGAYRRGAHDPTIRVDGHEAWRAARTPAGAASLHLCLERSRVRATAWGPGATWTVEHVPDLLGFRDEPQMFTPSNGLLHELHRRHAGLRIGASGLVFEALLPTVLEQKVPGVEAWSSYARLVQTLGEPAPGDVGLFLQPSPRRLLQTPYWTAHRFGVERRRFTVIQHAASYAAQLERTASLPPHHARPVLMSLPGVGPWSAAEVSVVAYGDRDAVSVGDYHLPHQVAWALAGEPRGTDARMLELLEPYRGHRARVIRLLTLGGIQAPRFGPRMRLRRIARI
jgi:3-methyladenine DNA glycosylase/8-oxoguanine DNA glycosylase